jgi:hypothetical protein
MKRSSLKTPDDLFIYHSELIASRADQSSFMEIRSVIACKTFVSKEESGGIPVTGSGGP